MAKQEDFRTRALVEAAQLLAKAWVEKHLATPAAVAALAAGMGVQEPEKLLTRAEAAAELKIHPHTLDGLERDGKIRSERVGKRGVRYARSEINRYLSRRKT